MQDRQGRLFLALFISLGLWLGIQYVFFPPTEKTKSDPIEIGQNEPGNDKTNSTPEKPKIESPSTPVATIPLKPVDPSNVKKYYIETAPYLIELTSLGGRIEKFFIQNHPDPDGTEIQILKDEKKHSVEFNGTTRKAIEISRGNGFDFNPLSDKERIPYSMFNEVNFTSKYDPETMTAVFEALSPDKSYSLVKTYKFFPKENYFIFNLEVINRTQQKLTLGDRKNPLFFRSFGSLGPFPQSEADMTDRDRANYFRYYYLDGSFNDFLDGTTTDGFFSNLFGGKKSEDSRFDIKLTAGDQGALDFAGTGSRYFIAVLDPLGDEPPAGVLLDAQTGNETGVLVVYDNLTVDPSSSVQMDYAAYVGVREPDGLAFRDEALDPFKKNKTPFKGLSDALDKSFNQGLTTPFRNGIVWILKKLYQYVVPNYGWAIIVFAILFKAVFFPLNQKQADSMKKMQELSPQIKEINEKYADDAQLKQSKIMELYKKNKVNPMGGCAPMLIQIPIFIALYTAFSDTVDLWESPFLWVKDLSEPDTIYTFQNIMGITFNLNALPLIMVGSQVLQSRLTIVSTDPNQKMMMYMMPVIMLYFFWSMPSGVTLYWTLQNLLSILQQVITNKFGKDAKLKKLNASGAANNDGAITAPTKPAGKRTPPPRGRKKK